MLDCVPVFTCLLLTSLSPISLPSALPICPIFQPRPSAPPFCYAYWPSPSAPPFCFTYWPSPSAPPFCFTNWPSPSALPVCLAHRPPISSKLHAYACLQCSYVLDPVTNMTWTASMEVRHFVVVNDKDNIVVRGRANVCLNLCT